MEWKDLSIESKCVLERCWGFYDDMPRSFSVTLDESFRVVNEMLTATEETYKEILKYQKYDKHFDVERFGNVVTVRGNCDYGSWLDQEVMKG